MKKLLLQKNADAFLCGRFTQKSNCFELRNCTFTQAVKETMKVNSCYFVEKKGDEYVFWGWFFQKMERREVLQNFPNSSYCSAVLKLNPNCKHFLLTIGCANIEIIPLVLFTRVEKVTDTDLFLCLAQNFEASEKEKERYKFHSIRGC